MNQPIYLDHNATTPVDPRVLAAMLPFFSENFGNAASITHGFGCEALSAVDIARGQVAKLIGAQPRDLVFTSGATESINLALKGAAEFYRDKGRHIVTVATEHRAALEVCEHLAATGWEVTTVGVSHDGLVDPEAIASAIRPDTTLINCMLANNEIGTIHDVATIGRITKERGVILHCDATQAVGKEPVDVIALGVDLLSFSAHKLYGPKGVGAMYVRRREPHVRLAPQLHGGGHERNLRPGTQNVPGIVGFGVACAIAGENLPVERERQRALKERLWSKLAERCAGLERLGHPQLCLANTLNVVFAGIDAKKLLVACPDVAASIGSACTSAMPKPSHVLAALGLGWRKAEGAVRLSLGRGTTADAVDAAVTLLADAAHALSAGQQAKQR